MATLSEIKGSLTRTAALIEAQDEPPLFNEADLADATRIVFLTAMGYRSHNLELSLGEEILRCQMFCKHLQTLIAAFTDTDLIATPVWPDTVIEPTERAQ